MTGTIGRGWATVDLERAERDVPQVLGTKLRFVEATRSALLGARCRRAEAPDGEWIVLLEADTEGRLAGFLARHGEGWAATWERHSTRDRRPTGASGEAGAQRSLGLAGPLGLELLRRDRPVRGPFRLVLMAATIEP
jgi:hypothetical protein